MRASLFLFKVHNRVVHKLDLERRLQHWDDEHYLRLIFRLRTGQRLDLANPRSFSQKLQWLKLNDRKPLYTMLVDKYEVKKWVSERIGEKHVVPNLGLWNSFDEIQFDTLPEQFVLKATHDSGGTVICADRTTFNRDSARAKLEKCLSMNYYHRTREWPYRDVTPRILAEVYLPSWIPSDVNDFACSGDSGALSEIMDYKFYCFHGEPKFLYVSKGLHDHSTARMDFLDLDWTSAGFSRLDYRHFDELPPRPRNLELMIRIARKLSAEIPFVRVDLFEEHGRVLFSEMTFSPTAGMMQFCPRSADLEIGRLLDLSRV